MPENKRLLAEWEPQRAVLMAWPHENTDWKPYLAETEKCFAEIAKNILKYEALIIVCQSTDRVKKILADADPARISLMELPSNDTWARDFGPITVVANSRLRLLDFTFNGWGQKFPAELDNDITKRLFISKLFDIRYEYQNQETIVLEGGSIETDGNGALLTTSQCLLSEGRNNFADKTEAENCLKSRLGVKRFLWLDHGYLAGDDTDSHIDTLARFCSQNTIAYVKCDDRNDEHYEELSLMEKQLSAFKTAKGEPYRLIPLPMAEPAYFDGERLPATYANFLIINGAVLFPTYNSDSDKIAENQLRKAFPDRDIIGIDCSVLIRQHGSLHCATMQIY